MDEGGTIMNPIEKDMVVVSLSPSYNKWKVIYKMLDEEGIKTEATIAKNQGYCILASLEDNICHMRVSPKNVTI